MPTDGERLARARSKLNLNRHGGVPTDGERLARARSKFVSTYSTQFVPTDGERLARARSKAGGSVVDGCPLTESVCTCSFQGWRLGGGWVPTDGERLARARSWLTARKLKPLRAH